jgi:hypothetical protein
MAWTAISRPRRSGTRQPGQTRAKAALRALGIVVVVSAFGIGVAELSVMELTGIALSLGLSLFTIRSRNSDLGRSNGRAAEGLFRRA